MSWRKERKRERFTPAIWAISKRTAPSDYISSLTPSSLVKMCKKCASLDFVSLEKIVNFESLFILIITISRQTLSTSPSQKAVPKTTAAKKSQWSTSMYLFPFPSIESFNYFPFFVINSHFYDYYCDDAEWKKLFGNCLPRWKFLRNLKTLLIENAFESDIY